MADMLVRTLDLRADLPIEGNDRLTVYALPQRLAAKPDADEAEFRDAMGMGKPADRVPAGKYLFSQQRGEPDAASIAEEALEQQREGLWRGEALAGTLYLRVIEEESGVVRQLIRALGSGAHG